MKTAHPTEFPIATYAELLDVLRSLSPEQLAQPVRWWGEDRGGRMVRVDVLECEYGNVSGDGHESREAYANDPEAWEGASNILPAGTVLLSDESPAMLRWKDG